MNTRSRKRLQSYSPIEKLPIEMLLEIFGYLDSWSIRRCSETCITFFHVTLRPQFKKFFKLTMKDVYLAPHCGIGKLFAPGNRTKRIFEHLALGSVTFKTLPFAKSFFMRLGGEITEMELTSEFFTPLMREKVSESQDEHFRANIFNNFPNLEKLIMKKVDLSDLKYFPSSLKEINVNTLSSMEELFDYEKSFKDVGRLINLKKLTFSKLNSFDDEDFSATWKLTDAVKSNLNDFNEFGVLDYFENSFNILEDAVLDLTHITRLSFDEMSSISFVALHRFPNLKSVELNLEEGVDCCTDHHQEFPSFTHVQELKLHFDSVSVCNTCITNITSSFTGLTKLNLKGNLTDFQYRHIYANMPKLEYLELHGLIPRHIFDSAEHSPNSIEQLKNLQHLLVYDTSYKSFTGLSNKCYLKFAHLPHLKTLRLSQSYEANTIKVSGIQHLVRQCPNVSTFSTTDKLYTDTIEVIVRGWPHVTSLLLPNGTIWTTNLWNVIKRTCHFLQYLSVHRLQVCLSFTDQCSLFKSIPSLKCIKKGDDMFTRSDYHEQDVYLEKYGQRHSEVSLKRKHSAIQSTSNKKRCLTYNSYSSSTFPQIETDDSNDPYYSDGEYSDANSERPPDDGCPRCGEFHCGYW